MRFDGGCLYERGIEFYAVVPFSACGIINERRLGALKKRLEPESVILFLVPYYTGEEKRNISKYAVPRDYHLLCAGCSTKFVLCCPKNTAKISAGWLIPRP